ncbi:MAG: dihydrodipicolinate synthase family protein [Bacteroidetes bacterium]|nr:dihydrodipicolinate synthase family protein [Bacteroidota bacterium]
MEKRLGGLVIAMPTPLLDNEDLDIPSFRRLIDHCIEDGADGLMILGSMGEGAALLDAVREAAIEVACEQVNKRLPLLVTVSGASTRRTLSYARRAEQLGADYLVTTSPYYYRFPDPESMLTHVSRTAESTRLPLIFYNAPGSTGNPVATDTLDRILQLPAVSGVKDSACQFGSFSELLRRYPDKASRPGTIMQGDESVYDASLLLGCDGLVTGGGVCFIRLLKALCEAGMQRDIDSAMSLQAAFWKGMTEMLLPDLPRNWMFNIKEKLADNGVIAAPYATAPFMHNWRR